MEISYTPEEKITAAKIILQKKYPFWGFLIMHMQVRKDNSVPTMGVDDRGILYWNEEFVKELKLRELVGCLAHEVMHLVFEHPKMGKHCTYKNLFNIVTDAKINNILLQNGFSLPQDAILPYNNTFEFGDLTIKDLDKTSSIELYEKLKKYVKKRFGIGGRGANNKRGQYPFKIPDYLPQDSYDKHMWDDTDDGEKGKGQNKGQDIDWKQLATEAYQYAQMRGNAPLGIDKYIDSLLHPRLNWRELLYKYILNVMPFDYIWSKPHKKSFSTGIYYPNIYKEKIEIVVTLDTSGSMFCTTSRGEDILQLGLSELASIAQSFDNLDMILIMGDHCVQKVFDMKQVSEQDIIEIGKQIKGGGGTSHKPFYNWIEKNKPDAKLVINFTDGWTEFPDKEIGDTIWLLPPEHEDLDRFPFGKCIVIE